MRPLRPRIIYLLNHLNMMVRKKLDERLKPLQLGGLQYTILTLVRDRDGISSAELSRRFFVTPQTMNESVTVLEQRGLIYRTESTSNKRILNAHVTPQGSKLLKSCDRIADEVEEEVFGSLPEEHRRILHDVLRSRLHQIKAG